MFFTQISNLINSNKIALKYCILSYVIVAVIIMIVIWNWPFKKALKYDVSVFDYAINGKIAIICEGGGNTGPTWRIIESSESFRNNYILDIDITGYTPDKILKNPLYIYLNSKFLFIGKFSVEGNDKVFVVENWHLVGTIERVHLIMPYPKSCLNIFEISL